MADDSETDGRDAEEGGEPDQIALMERMVAMATERTRMATQRTELATQRTSMAEVRTALANERTVLARERTDMAAERTYMAAERTLSVWIRTALTIMVFGLAIDRFGLMLEKMPASATGPSFRPDTISFLGGTILVAFGTVMALITGARFLTYVAQYRRQHEVPFRHGPYLAPIFALLVALFGVALLILLIVFAPWIAGAPGR